MVEGISGSERTEAEHSALLAAHVESSGPGSGEECINISLDLREGRVW